MDTYTIAKEQIMIGHYECSGIPLELGVADTPELIEEARNIIYQAFMEYLLCKWGSEAVVTENGLREEYHRELVKFFSFYGSYHVSTKERGAFCFARNSETKQIVAVFALANAKTKPVGSNIFSRFYYNMKNEIIDVIDLIRMGLPPSIYIHRYGFDAYKRVSAMDDLKIHHNTAIGNKDHLYLIQIAVLPALQGKGIGELMLKKLNNIADALQLPIYLETDTIRHEKLYSRFGFQTRVNYTLRAGDSVFEPNFGMVRDPKPLGSSPSTPAQENSAAITSS